MVVHFRGRNTGIVVLGPPYEAVLERFKAMAGDWFCARRETISKIEIERSENPALHVFH
jgi:hypothetical protein